MLAPEEAPADPNYAALYAGVEVLPVTPLLVVESNLAMTAGIFDAVARSGAAALILTGYATGTTPTALNPFIRNTVDRGVPVIILSDNKGEDSGPQRIKYLTQLQAVDAGATVLKDVNINKRDEVAAAIQVARKAGRAGVALAAALVEQYGTPTKYFSAP